MNTVEISVIAPCYNEEAGLPEFVRRMSAVLAAERVSYEIVLVDDGSRDGTRETAMRLAAQVPNITVISLSRNFGHQAAVTAGLDHVGDGAVVLIDSDLQDPPEVVSEMIAKWREGYDVVYGQRRSRRGESRFKLQTANLFYRLMSVLTNHNLPRDVGDFRLMDRRVAHALRLMREQHRFIRGMVNWVGFKQIPVPYDREPRLAGKTNYPLAKMLLFATDAVTSFSTTPLRLITYSGLATILLTALLAIVILGVRLLAPHYFIPGFTALSLAMLFFGGLQIVSIGVVGEYIGRIYEEVKGRPLYLVRDILYSDIRTPRTPDVATHKEVCEP